MDVSEEVAMRHRSKGDCQKSDRECTGRRDELRPGVAAAATLSMATSPAVTIVSMWQTAASMREDRSERPAEYAAVEAGWDSTGRHLSADGQASLKFRSGSIDPLSAMSRSSGKVLFGSRYTRIMFLTIWSALLTTVDEDKMRILLISA
jgi:hypothetical protein